MKLVDRSLLEDLGLTVGHFEVLSLYHVPVHKNQYKIPNNIQQLNKVRKERQYNGESLSVPVHQNHHLVPVRMYKPMALRQLKLSLLKGLNPPRIKLSK